MSESNEIINKKFASIMTEEIIQSGLYFTIKKQYDLDTYAYTLAYRVQRDFYDLAKENGLLDDMDWELFRQGLSHTKEGRKKFLAVLIYAVMFVCDEEYFNFNVREAPSPFRDTDYHDSVDDNFQFIRMCPDEKGREIVNAIMLRGQIAYYHYLQRTEKTLTWKRFQLKLFNKGSLSTTLQRSVQDAIARLDFRPIWAKNDICEIIDQIDVSGMDPI